jgi:long-chain acyl-CoA synthetase
MIDSGGAKVYPKDIKEIVVQHPAVSDVAVFGIPHDKWGETPIAAVVLRPAATVSVDELCDWINARVAARYQRVDRVVISSPRWCPLRVRARTRRRTGSVCP